jgi:hypothetical protein
MKPGADVMNHAVFLLVAGEDAKVFNMDVPFLTLPNSTTLTIL